MHKTLPNLLCIALLLSACTATEPYSGDLTQAPPRKPADSLQLPADTTLGPVVAGLSQDAVPQGMSQLPSATATVITSHYADDGGPSRLVLTHWDTGVVTGTVRIIEPGGTVHVGHVGGIAADEHSLWVASDAYLYRGDIDPLVHGSGATDYPMVEQISTEATYEVAFCAVYNGLVWAGEFALDEKYPTDPSHHLKARDGTLRRGWISGYDPNNGFEHPQQVLSIPDRAQGMYATQDYIYLSISYGRRHRSRVEIHRNPLSTPPHLMVKTSKGQSAPLWFLDANTELRSIDLPPMSQNLIVIDGQLAVLFESGAAKFRFFGKKPLDHILLLPLDDEQR